MALNNGRPQNGWAEHHGGCPSAEKPAIQQCRADGRNQSVPSLTHHARERWAERAPDTKTDIETAWTQSLSIAAPARDCDRARLYAPSDLVFLVRSGVVTTVCPANYDNLVTGHLGRCSQCGNLERYAAGDAVCRWCGNRSTTIRLGNGVEVTFEGEV